MNDETWLRAQEYIFSLGCKCGLPDDEVLPTESVCYRSLHIAAFGPTYIISVMLIGPMAELTFCAEESCTRSIDEFNAKFRWMKVLAAAIENSDPLPMELPPGFCFVQARGDLTPAQIDWLQTQMESLQPLCIQSQPDSRYARDGQISMGRVKQYGQPSHAFYLWNRDASRYHRVLYDLAATVIQEPRCVEILNRMRRDTR